MESVKEIIDKHFQSNYEYYKSVCRSYYKKRYIYEDLLHETYSGFLKVKESTIIQFHELNRLHNIGLKIIRSLYQKRNQKQRKGDSPLKEDNTVLYYEENNEGLCCFDEVFDELEQSEERITKERKLDTMNSLISANKDNRKIQLLIMNTHEKIVDIARESKTTTYYITKEINEAKEFLKANL